MGQQGSCQKLVSHNLGGTLLSWQLQDDLTALSTILYGDTALVNHDTGSWHGLGGHHAPPVSHLGTQYGLNISNYCTIALHGFALTC